MEYKDYYKIMGVARDASPEQLKKAHRKLARQYHPDVSKEPNAEARFKEISEAYDVLRDPDKRAAYDQLGAQWRAGQDFRPPPGWNAGQEARGAQWHAHRSGARQPEAGAEEFSDFFESLFGRSFQGSGFASGPPGETGSPHRPRRAGPAQRGEDHHAKILIALEDAYRGATRSVRLQGELEPGSPRVHEISFDVPKGIRAGQRIRLASQGGPGRGGGPAGDLFLEVSFAPPQTGQPDYRLERHDVLLDLPLSPWEAVLGGVVKAPTPTGWVEVNIPPNSPSGRKLRLKGRGLPASTPGDFYFVLQISTPPANSEAARSFYQGMASRFTAFEPRARWQLP